LLADGKDLQDNSLTAHFFNINPPMENPRILQLNVAWAGNSDPGPLTEEERIWYGKLLDFFISKAKAGDVGCQFDLGVKYVEGIFVSSDFKRAAMWFSKAAEGGDLDAILHLSALYCLGLGVEQDYELAFDLVLQAAKAGVMQAQYEVSRMYRQGVGTDVDAEEGFRWLQAAAVNPDEKPRFSKTYQEKIGPADSLIRETLIKDGFLTAGRV
jgi:TPR repeat protein